MEREAFQELLDRTAITELVSRLGRWLDEKRFDDRSASDRLFVPEIVVQTPGGRAEGVADISAMARKNHSLDKTQHVHTNVLIDFDGPDRADVEANLIVTFVPKANEPHVFSQLGTHYHFVVVRAAAGWRFSSIRDAAIWRTPLST